MAGIKHIGIISIMEGYPWGGSEMLWYEMALAALDKGHKVSISYKYWDDLPHALNQLEAKGAELYLRKTKYIKKGLFRRLWDKLNKKNTPILKENSFESIFDTQPDVLLINEGAFGSILNFPNLYQLILKTGIPYNILSHQNREFGAICEEWLDTVKLLYSQARQCFFVSEGNKAMAELMLCQKLLNSRVVRNPVNLYKTDLVSFPNSDSVQLACVGRLFCKQKGQDILLRVLHELKDIYNFKLFFFGMGEDEGYLKSLTNYLGLNQQVHFAGHVSDIRAIWEQQQILVLPSHYEGMPLVVVEAMLCGRPCLVTDVAGHTEWIEDGKQGYICESPTVSALKRTILRAFDDRDNWEQMGVKARDKALELYDKNSGNSLLEAILRNKND